MAETKIPKERLGPLAIEDDDVNTISLEKLNQSGASNGQVPQWNDTDEIWEATSLVAGSTYVDAEVPSGTKNSINKIFTIQFQPSPPSSLQLFIGGTLLLQGVSGDYTIDNQTITLVRAPSANDVITAFYRR